MAGKRSLEERLTEYRDVMFAACAQLDHALDHLPEALTREQHDAIVSLRASAQVQQLVGEDLTKILNGEELEKYAMEVEI